MERDVEGLVELVVRLEVGPVGEPGNEDQVAGGGDRQKLGCPLDDAECECLPIGERPGDVTHAQCGKDERDAKGHRGRNVDPEAAHSTEYRSLPT